MHIIKSDNGDNVMATLILNIDPGLRSVVSLI